MRVVHVSKITGISGSERHLLILLPALAQYQDIAVEMVVLEEPSRPADTFCNALQALDLPVTRFLISGDIAPGLSQRLARHFKQVPPDIVHTHLIHADLYGQLAARQAGVPVTISSRHNDNPFRRNPLIKLVNRLAMQRTHTIITISEALAEFVHSVEGIDSKKIATVRYGMPPPVFGADARQSARKRLGIDSMRPVIGFFGRLIHQKGVDTLLKAFSQISRSHPDATLTIAGDGVLRRQLEQLARDLGIGGQTQFTGWLEDAYQVMPACDLVVMPSRWEGFGLVALEAMSCARPLIASRVSALPEIVVNGQTGLLIPPDDPAVLARAITEMLLRPDWANSLGRAGYERLVAEFSVEKMVDATYAVYCQAVNAQHSKISDRRKAVG